MTNINAALGCGQLERLSQTLKEKRRLAQVYAKFFEDKSEVSFLREPDHTQSNYWLCAVRLESYEEQEKWLKYAADLKIQLRPLWELISDLPMYRNHPRSPLETAQKIQKTVVCLPSSAKLGRYFI